MMQLFTFFFPCSEKRVRFVAALDGPSDEQNVLPLVVDYWQFAIGVGLFKSADLETEVSIHTISLLSRGWYQ